MNYLPMWITQDVALARSNAMALCKDITARSTEAVPWLKANFKLYAFQQPLPRTTLEVILVDIQKPIIVPAIVLYGLCFFVFLDTVYCACCMWGDLRLWRSDQDLLFSR